MLLNPQAEELTGYSRQEMLGRPAYELIVPPEQHQKVLQRNRQRMDGTSEIYETQIRRKDGSLIWIESHAAPYRNPEGEIVGTIGSLSDITKRKRDERAVYESEERYRSVFERTSEGVFLADFTTERVVDSNAAFQEMLGYAPEELAGMTVHDFIAERPEDTSLNLQSTREGSHFLGEMLYLCKDSSPINVEVSATHIPYGDREVSCIIARDITRRKRAEEDLEESEQRLRNVITGAPVIQFALDEEGVITLSEGTGLGALGLEPGEGVGHSVFEAYSHSPSALDNVRRALAGEEVASTVEIEGIAFDTRYSPVQDENGRVTGVISVATDITERRKLESELEHRAFHDPLTDLPNRALFEDRLSHALGRAVRRQGSVAVLFMDLDNFKLVNDSLGHEAGDALLVAVAQRLRECLRPEDTVSRLGGDEFVILLEETDLEEAARVAERVAEAFRSPLVFGEAPHEMFLSMSVGITLGGSAEQATENLLKKADIAMYRAKEKGKSRHQVFDPQMDNLALGRLKLANELRRAIEGDELRLHYQPKVDLQSGVVIGFETLVRWEHPNRGLLSPAEFIPVAEENGLIVELGRWVLWEACRQAGEWQGRYPDSLPPKISVNLSAERFSHNGLGEEVEEALWQSGLAPSALELEITESTIMGDIPSSAAILEHLKSLGIRVAVDDFGKGHSSLSYLKRLPVDALKIDRSMVEGLGRDPKDEAIVSAIIELAHALGQWVVGEGVEDAGQLETLQRLGCELGQGNYFGGPLTAEGAIELYLDAQKHMPGPKLG